MGEQSVGGQKGPIEDPCMSDFLKRRRSGRAEHGLDWPNAIDISKRNLQWVEILP